MRQQALEPTLHVAFNNHNQPDSRGLQLLCGFTIILSQYKLAPLLKETVPPFPRAGFHMSFP